MRDGMMRERIRAAFDVGVWAAHLSSNYDSLLTSS